MDDPQTPSPRARMQALQAIPESKRTDAEWDELNELEILLASGNRQGAPGQSERGNPPAPGGHPGRGAPRQGQKQERRFHQRPPRRNPR
jgi:hypothetical protein